MTGSGSTDGFRARFHRYLPLISVLTVGAAAYVALALLQASDLDEGNYLLAALQIAHGQIPFVNFVGVEPAVPYYLSVGVLLFGPSLVVARLQLVLLVLATAFGLYSIGRSQHSEGAGLLAASLFLFSPLSLYYSSIVILEAASLAPLVFAAAILLRKKVSSPAVPSLCIGLLLGVAVLTRRDTALLAPLFVAVAALRSRGWERLGAALGIGAGFFLMIGPVLGYFAFRTSGAWLNAQYGFGAGYAYSATGVQLPLHVGGLAYGILTLPALAVGLMGVLNWFLGTVRHPRAARWALGFVGLPTLGVLIYGLSYQSWGQGESLFPYVGLAVGVILLAWVVLRLELSRPLHATGTREVTAVPFLAAWFALILLFFTFVYPAFFVHYLIELTAPASLLAGLFVADRFAQIRLAPIVDPQGGTSQRRPRARRRWRSAAGGRALRVLSQGRVVFLALVLVVPSAVTGILILGPTNPYNDPYANGLQASNLYQRVYPLSEIQQVANYIDAHSLPNETVFTADAIFAAVADRLILLNLSTILDDYAYPRQALPMNQSPLGSNSFGLAPSWSEIFAVWNRTYVPLVVIGNRTLSMEASTPYLPSYLAERYHPVATFDPGLLSQVVTIEAMGRGPTGAQFSRTVPAFSNSSSIVVNPANGVVYLADAHNASIEVAFPSGTEGWVTLPPPAEGVVALALAPSDATLAAATPEGAVLVYSVAPSGTLSLTGTIATVVPIAQLEFGAVSTTVYAFVPTFAEVLELDTTNSSVLRAIKIIPDASSFAVDPAADRFAVGDGTSANVVAYNLTSGGLIQYYGIGAAIADQLAFAGPYLIATQRTPPETIWLDWTNGRFSDIPNGGGPSQGFTLAGGMVFVGGSGDGLITVFNSTTGDPSGFVLTGTCASALAYDTVRQALWVAGPCAPEAEVWSLPRPSPYAVAAPAGAGVFLDGLQLTEPMQASLLSGVYVIEVVQNGGSSTTLLTVSGPGSISVSAPDLASAWLPVQAVFLALVIVGSGAAVWALTRTAVRRPELFAATLGDVERPSPTTQ